MSNIAISISLVVLLGSSTLQSAIIDLQNPIDGSAGMVMTPGVPTDVNLVMITSVVDTVPIAFVNAFLDTNDDLAEVVAVAGGQNWIYDRTAFTLPASLDEAGSNEYGLVCGDDTGDNALPLGSATHVIDALTLITNANSGTTTVTFETGVRSPQVFGPAPTYYPFIVCPPNFGCAWPNMLYLGDPASENDPFTVTYIPEPMMLFVMVLIAAIRPRNRWQLVRETVAVALHRPRAWQSNEKIAAELYLGRHVRNSRRIRRPWQTRGAFGCSYG